MSRASTFESLRAAARSPRVGAVALQSFSSGMPLGLVWKLLPAWLAYRHVDIKTIGLFTLAQAPWTFKFLWAPLMDRYSPPWLGRRRSWILIAQVLLVIGALNLALEARSPTVSVVAALALFVAFASASQDIAIDAYAVDILEREEMGLAVGARVALYRLGMYLAGSLAITVGATLGWPVVFVGIALLFLPMMAVVVASPEPAVQPDRPKSLREAVWEPLIGIFRMNKALEILTFVLLFKFGENLATALTGPFLIQKGFPPGDVGVAVATVGLVATLVGTFAGGMATTRLGLGRTLWITGVLQAVGCLGYACIDQLGAPTSAFLFDPHRLMMYLAVGGEAMFQGMAAGAFDVLLLRLTSRSFSATQFAIFSSLFALGRVIAGPPAGYLVDAIGWTPFFFLTVVASVPGLLLLQRFAPIGIAEPDLHALAPAAVDRPLGRVALAAWSFLGLLGGFTMGIGVTALLAAAKEVRKAAVGTQSFALLERLTAHHAVDLFTPRTAADVVAVAGPIAFGLVCALATGSLLAVRRGIRSR
jgi:MFS transporter, PAT family, beta-lactamase induction signal transducer AmpG